MARRLLAACLLGMLVLSGCGGSPAEEPTKAASPSPTKTTPAVPELPQTATKNTDEAATAFTRHYIDLLNLAQATGSTEGAMRASLETCKGCTAALTKVENLQKMGATIEGGAWALKKASVVARPEGPAGSNPTAVVAAEIDADEQVVREPGKSPTTYPAGRVKYFFTLSWTDTGWKVAAWDPA